MRWNNKLLNNTGKDDVSNNGYTTFKTETPKQIFNKKTVFCGNKQKYDYIFKVKTIMIFYQHR